MTYDDIKQALAESFGCDTVILLNPGFRPPDDLTGFSFYFISFFFLFSHFCL